jgi:hypothetical protein
MNPPSPAIQLLRCAVVCAAWLAAATASATTYVMMADEDLADQAPVIAVVHITGIEPSTEAGVPSTDYVAQVERAVKGAAAGSVRVRVPGGETPGGGRFRVFGAPRFGVGERALLFLEPRADGAYGVSQAMLGAFREAPSSGEATLRLAVRDLSEATEVARRGSPARGPDLPRDFDRFVAWLADRAAGRWRAPDYFTPGAAAPPAEFTQLGNGRWFQFDTGGSVPWVALAGGQAGMPGGGFVQFQSALAAWNAEPATPINLTYNGTTTNSGNPCNGGNAIRWNDPNNEIPGSFNCASGGVLAQGGYCQSGTGTFNGMLFDRISEGDVVIQDGAGCFLSGNGNEDGEEVFGHELGHSLGLGHSCTSCVPGSPLDQALMRAFAHGDGRGAALNSDDQAGARFLYQPTVAMPSISIADVTVTEGNSPVNAVFTVSLSGASAQTVTVGFATADGTATAGSDYTAASGLLTFPSGTTVRTVTVAVTGDLMDEPTENFSVNLSAPTNATLADAQAVGTILDNDPAPALAITDCAVPEGNVGTVNCLFTVSLSAPSAFPISVTWATAAGTATSGVDFVAGTGTLTFPAGTASQPLAVAVNGDVLDEPNETFLVNLTAPVNATLADAQGQGTIQDDDAAAAVSLSDCTVTEGNAGQASCTFTVTLSAASGFPVTVAYATADGTAVAGQDYVAASGTLTFTAGSTSQPLAVAVNGDLLDEPDETFTLNLSAPVNATIADGQGTGTIVDDDPAAAISTSDCLATEGDAGQASCTFTISLSSASSFPISVAYTTADGTAVAGQDYAAASGTLTLAAGSTSQPLSVAVIGDLLDEADETFTLTLSSPVNATLADGQGIGTIVDNDPQPSVSVGDCAVLEGNAGTVPCTFTVSLSAPSSFTVNVSYATADGTATAGSDYTVTSGTLTFAPGSATQTLTVPVLGDGIVEVDETFFVNLTGPSNATLGDAQGVGTIGDDDAPALSSHELHHGSVQHADLLVRPDLYRIGQKPYSSYEIVIDATSGDIVPVALERLAGNNVAVLQSATPVAVGGSVSLRWENTTALTVTNQHIRVDGSCATPCDALDTYRIRAFETTYSVPRFNNAGSQVTVLLLQNPASYAVAGNIWFWSTSGALLATRPFSLLEKQTVVLNTASVTGANGQGGTITISHNGRYGDLSGKTVALEPSTGFSFDSPMSPRAR